MGHVVIRVFRPRADMGFGYFRVIRLSRYVVLIHARRSCLYHTCKKNVFSSTYMINWHISFKQPCCLLCYSFLFL